MIDVSCKLLDTEQVELKAINPNFNDKTFQRLIINLKNSDETIIVYPHSTGAYRDPLLWCAHLNLFQDEKKEEIK